MKVHACNCPQLRLQLKRFSGLANNTSPYTWDGLSLQHLDRMVEKREAPAALALTDTHQAPKQVMGGCPAPGMACSSLVSGARAHRARPSRHTPSSQAGHGRLPHTWDGLQLPCQWCTRPPRAPKPTHTKLPSRSEAVAPHPESPAAPWRWRGSARRTRPQCTWRHPAGTVPGGSIPALHGKHGGQQGRCDNKAMPIPA